MKHDAFDRGGLTAWVDDRGRLFAVGGDGELREYADAPGVQDLLSADLDRIPFGAPRAVAELLLPAGARLRAPTDEDALAAEWVRTIAVLLAAIVTGTFVAMAIDYAGTLAIVTDLIGFWFL